YLREEIFIEFNAPSLSRQGAADHPARDFRARRYAGRDAAREDRGHRLRADPHPKYRARATAPPGLRMRYKSPPQQPANDRPAAALDRCIELPRKIDGIADAAVHAKPTGRDDEMRRVTRDEHATLAIALRQQQVLLPLAHIKRVELERQADGLGKQRHHVGIA